MRRAILMWLITVIGLGSASSQHLTSVGPSASPVETDQSSVARPALNVLPRGTSTAKSVVTGKITPGSIGRGNPLWAIPLTSLSATKERPIFSPTRRPPAIAQQPSTNSSASLPNRPPFALVGVIAGDGGGVAIFRDETTKRTLRLKTGEAHLGWTLLALKGREATLRKEVKTAILTLPNPPAK